MGSYLNISSDTLDYANYRGMYKGGIDGVGLQCGHEGGTTEYEAIKTKCGEVTDLLRELNELTIQPN